MEFVGPSKRRIAGVVGGFHWMAGNVILAGLGYAIRDWSTLQLTCALPGIVFQLWWWWVKYWISCLFFFKFDFLEEERGL